jgi:ABC-type dipeptide/oligopeptide/nickel transport system permease subunit
MRIRASLGTDQPFIMQYLNFLKGMVTLDFGRSFTGGTSVSLLIGNALPATLLLAFISMFVSIALSIPLGIKAATSRGKGADQAIRILSLIGLSFPNFWLATMLVLLFAMTLGWLPPSGMSGWMSYHHAGGDHGHHPDGNQCPAGAHVHAGNPAIAIHHGGPRKGPQRSATVLYKHALRNCAIPLITYFGLQFGGLLGGIVVSRACLQLAGHGHACLRCGLGPRLSRAAGRHHRPVADDRRRQSSGRHRLWARRSAHPYGVTANGHQDLPPSRFYSLEFILGASLTLVICLAVLLSDVLFPGGAEKIDLIARLTKPFTTLAYPLGTDPLGRDVLARVVAGGKISLLVGFTSVIGAVIFGV